MKIIAFEGIDASGKDTQSKMLYDKLSSLGYKTAIESFPRYSLPIGVLLKQWFNREIELSTEAVHMLLEADRQDYMREINALIDEGFDFLILDRFILSNLAYGMAKGIDINWLRSLQAKIKAPDVTFILDIKTGTSIKRKRDKLDRHEVDTNLLSKAKIAYTVLANKFSKEEDYFIYVVDADKASPDIIHEVIMDYIKNLYL